MNIRKLLNPVKIFQRLYWLATNQAVIVDVLSLKTMQNDSNQLKELIKSLDAKKNNFRKREHLLYVRPDLQMMKPPVFIFGPPRSGSSYLVEAMNMHEEIFITSELRVMSFINDLFRLFLKSNRADWNLANEYKEPFLRHFRSEMADVIRRFYLTHLPNPQAIWGDKHPHYSDPALDPGALETILEIFPEAKFIHIYRDPREQIYSVTQKGWKDFQYTVLAYRRIVTTGRAFGKKVGPDRYMEVTYEDLCNQGEKVACAICDFLGIPRSERWLEFMRQQENKRTPFSEPVTEQNEIGKRKRILFSPEEEEYYGKILGKLAKELGYE